MKKKYGLIATAVLAICGLSLPTRMVVAQIKPLPATTTSTAKQNKNETLTTFQTDNYSVRVFRQGNQTRINLFDKRTNELKLNAAPVKIQSQSEQTSYAASEGGLNYLISVDKNGFKSVQIVGPGQSIQESTNMN